MAAQPKTADIHPGPGFRIRSTIARPARETIEGLAAFDMPAISDMMNRLYTMAPAIRNLTAPEMPIIGPACTVKVYPGDNLMVHKALDIAAPGDIIVVDAGGSEMGAVLGDLVSTKARHRGIGGFIVDGLIRDLPGIIALGFPVFARGVTPVGPLHRGPGEINYPVQCGGVVVHPGDIVIGDANGVVVIPQELAASVLLRLADLKQAEASYHEAVRRGEFSNAWVDTLLAETRCELEDDAAPARPKGEGA